MLCLYLFLQVMDDVNWEEDLLIASWENDVFCDLPTLVLFGFDVIFGSTFHR